MSLKNILIFLLFLVPLNAISQVDSTLLELFQNNKNELKLFNEKNLEDFNRFTEENRAALKKFMDEVEEIWGENSKFQLYDQTHYVEYSENLNSRMTVDFEKGIISLDVITNDMQKQQEEIKNAINELFNTSGKTIVKEDIPTKINSKPILEDQIIDFDISDVEIKTVKITGKNGEVNTVTTLEINLAPNHIQKRANIYLGLVQTYSQKYNLDPELVLAMIHTESYFNPMAKSWANAYGLMQLVPKYGGRAAYKYVTGEDKIPTPEYLYVPRNNIELGCAYIHILETTVFQHVEDKKNKEYCVVSSYNCGAGNLARVFVSSTNIKKAIKKINTNSSKQNYIMLQQKLPQETKDYLKIVLERKEQYYKWKSK